ncbi:hypothetical protein OIE66_23495 [Nonomuraea sp. NBC_01738]|uniref:hypothetical protein n=1 Tax=Nonomuraea sp. NBC_01738 TaxID=2976003 RepID=UPI002E150B11|nr:hypothetical protein OIE66_23495 [Nonomuraea sp. NBC_01738]
MAEIPLLQAFAEVGYQVAGGGGAHGAMTALGRVVPLDAYEFVAYDPAAGAHRSVVSAGHERIDADAAGEYTALEAYRRAIATRSPVTMPERGTERYFRRHLEPYGWRAGLTAPLFLRGGRYTGLLHLAYRSAPPPDVGPLVAAAAPMLAHVTDLTRCVLSPAALPPATRRSPSTGPACGARCRAWSRRRRSRPSPRWRRWPARSSTRAS